MYRIKEVIAKGRVKLVQEFPVLLESANRVTPEQAQEVGLSLPELQEVMLLDSIRVLAEDLGEYYLDLLIRYGADSQEEAAELQARCRQILERDLETTELKEEWPWRATGKGV